MRRVVRHPGGPPLVGPQGRSGGRGGTQPGPGGLLGPAVPANPLGPGIPGGQAAQSAAGAAAQQISGAIGSAVQQAASSILAPGEVLVGVLLIAAGLLLATGQMGRVARGAGRAGLVAATRGAVR